MNIRFSFVTSQNHLRVLIMYMQRIRISNSLPLEMFPRMISDEFNTVNTVILRLRVIRLNSHKKYLCRLTKGQWFGFLGIWDIELNGQLVSGNWGILGLLSITMELRSKQFRELGSIEKLGSKKAHYFLA